MRGLFRSLCAVLVLLALSTTCVLAQTTATQTLTVQLKPGTLSMTTTGSFAFPVTTLTGNSLTISPTTLPVFTIIDARGNVAGGTSGWNVSFIMTTNFTGTGSGTGTDAIPASNFTLTTGAGAVTPQGSSDAAPNAETGNTGALTVLGTGVKAISAAVGTGKGTYKYTQVGSEYVLSIPNNQQADTYTGTLQITLASGP
ncbi:MAG: WxL domain-containing protein [Candidatus Xenobia bacterium]